MITTSEIAVTVTIWVMTAVGGFFVTRAIRRRRKQQRQLPRQEGHRGDRGER